MAKKSRKENIFEASAFDPRGQQVINMLNRLAAEDLTARVAPSGARDELDRIIVGLNVLAEELEANTRRLVALLAERERDAAALRLLAEMGSLLQAGATVEELYSVIADFLERLFPSASGALFTYGGSGNHLERKAAWGGFPVEQEEAVFESTECWGIRRGRVNIVRGAAARMQCGHVPESAPQAYLCAPVMGTDEKTGLLHLRFAALEAQTMEVSEFAVGRTRASGCYGGGIRRIGSGHISAAAGLAAAIRAGPADRYLQPALS